MTKLKLLSATLIAAAMLTTPAMARTNYVTSRHPAEDAHASASPAAGYIDGRVGISAPRVGALPPAPPDGENCDVGDNPRIC
jgi:methionine-rich copper-binding protein CopC